MLRKWNVVQERDLYYVKLLRLLSSLPPSGQKDDRSIISEVQKLTLSPEIEEDLRQKIHSDIEIMRHKFSALQTTIRKNVKKNVDHKDFAAHVFGMYILSEEHQKQVANASTVDDIFNILTKYWSFLDFSNLEDIAKNVYHESDTEKQIEQDTEKEKKQGTGEQIEQYKKDVQQFCERRVSEFPPGSLNNGTDSEGMDKLVVTLDLHDPSLKHVLRLKEVIANILGQPASKLVLYDIGSGSVVLTFLIATLLGEELFMKTSNTLTLTQKQKDKLLEVNVVSLEFKEVTLFSIHQERKSGIINCLMHILQCDQYGMSCNLALHLLATEHIVTTKFIISYMAIIL